MIDVAIIGAGPYGLSLAAFLKARGIDYRIFGKPMETWLAHMPAGMRLKSEGFASNIYDAHGRFTLKRYCAERSLPYSDVGLPVPLQTFADYGLAFQRTYLPELEQEFVVSVVPSRGRFELSLANGEALVARHVVVAAGITHFAHVPKVFRGMPEQLVTHSSQYGRLDQFRGRDVVVIGAGASALDIAALLHKAGARAEVVTRARTIHFHSPPEPAWKFECTLRQLKKGLGTAWGNLKQPRTGLGCGWDTVLCAHAPLAIHMLPAQTRVNMVRQILGPAPGWFVRDEVVGNVATTLGVDISNVKAEGDRVYLTVVDGTGVKRVIGASHVITATGYRPEVERLGFLSGDLRSQMRAIEGAPQLSTNFESSVRGLYFVGPASVYSFGPLARFAFGARFSAIRLSKHLSAAVSAGRTRVVVPSVREADSRNA